MDVLRRWKAYRYDAGFRSLFDDETRTLAVEAFPDVAEIEDVLRSGYDIPT